jgi:hypothetical protein
LSGVDGAGLDGGLESGTKKRCDAMLIVVMGTARLFELWLSGGQVAIVTVLRLLVGAFSLHVCVAHTQGDNGEEEA